MVSRTMRSYEETKIDILLQISSKEEKNMLIESAGIMSLGHQIFCENFKEQEQHGVVFSVWTVLEGDTQSRLSKSFGAGEPNKAYGGL